MLRHIARSVTVLPTIRMVVSCSPERLMDVNRLWFNSKTIKTEFNSLMSGSNSQYLNHESNMSLNDVVLLEPETWRQMQEANVFFPFHEKMILAPRFIAHLGQSHNVKLVRSFDAAIDRAIKLQKNIIVVSNSTLLAESTLKSELCDTIYMATVQQSRLYETPFYLPDPEILSIPHDFKCIETGPKITEADLDVRFKIFRRQQRMYQECDVNYENQWVRSVIQRLGIVRC